ncbi:MAG: NADH-dependent [FeFe] hydrogenase, group A6 [Hespellia sp.]|nr:NADH-dependent [FeFe] hydrogenase, group A6 [Hespellia sp.]
MVNITLNGKQIQVEKNLTIMEAAKQNGVMIPSLCFLKEINEIGACRVCVVEIEGKDLLVPSCNTRVEEGMVIYTNSPKVQSARESIVQMILSQHEFKCATCVRNGNCGLQKVAQDLNILEVPFPTEIEYQDWDQTFPIIRDSAKCIKCMRCVQICDKVQGLKVWDILNTGKRTSVNVRDNQDISKVNCAICGQCITHCPTGALRERDDTRKVLRAIESEDKIVVVQIAPAVRTAWGEQLGLSKEEASVGKMVAAVRRLGVNYVFDTDFSADLTIMEEGMELLDRVKSAAKPMPMFTSCCPGWVRFMKLEYPEYVEHLSTAKSPQQMFGAVTKSYFAEKLGVDPNQIFCVSIMPCVAKKYEADVEQVNDSEADKDVDAVLTTRELVRMMHMCQVNVDRLEEEEFDSPLGTGSGAGVIFGATGGVMEAALRSAYYFLNGENPGPDDFAVVRGEDGIREATVEIAGVKLRAAIVSGLGNTRKLMEKLKKKQVEYDFIEIMTCPGGCAGGGGQPIHDGEERAKERGDILYQLDQDSTLRFSHENPDVQTMYQEYFKEPLSEVSHHLLHTHQKDWEL